MNVYIVKTAVYKEGALKHFEVVKVLSAKCIDDAIRYVESGRIRGVEYYIGDKWRVTGSYASSFVCYPEDREKWIVFIEKREIETV